MLPYSLAMLYMISNCGVEELGNDYAKYAEQPAGTGPYMFDKLVPHERLELVKNANYWNPDRIPKHDRLVLLPMPEASTRAAALLSGQVDFVEAPSPDTIPALKRRRHEHRHRALSAQLGLPAARRQGPVLRHPRPQGRQHGDQPAGHGRHAAGRRHRRPTTL